MRCEKHGKTKTVDQGGLEGSPLTISLLFQQRERKCGEKFLQNTDPCRFTGGRSHAPYGRASFFYDDPPLWTIRLRNQPQGLLAPETGFYRPIYGIMRRRTPVFRTVRPLLPPQSAHLPTAVGPEEKQPFWCASPVPTAARPSVRLPLFLQDRGCPNFCP